MNARVVTNWKRKRARLGISVYADAADEVSLLNEAWLSATGHLILIGEAGSGAQFAVCALDCETTSRSTLLLLQKRRFNQRNLLTTAEIRGRGDAEHGGTARHADWTGLPNCVNGGSARLPSMGWNALRRLKAHSSWERLDCAFFATVKSGCAVGDTLLSWAASHGVAVFPNESAAGCIPAKAGSDAVSGALSEKPG